MKTELLDIRCMDCMDLMRETPDKAFGLAIVDPPYGIFGKKSCNMDWQKECDGGRTSKYGKRPKKWDVAPGPEYLTELRRVSAHQILFGANYFPYPFPNFAIWRKTTISEGFSMSMAEIASVSLEGNGKVFDYMPQDSERFHPTQKPVALYRWLLANYAKPGQTILDTHMGSGSIAIACHYAGNPLVACELDPDYYAAACARIERETRHTEFAFAATVAHQERELPL